MKIHQLKIEPYWFNLVLIGQKKFEVRKDDRNFEVGDMLYLKSYDIFSNKYLGEYIKTPIILKLQGGAHGIEHGYAVLGLGQIVAAGVE